MADIIQWNRLDSQVEELENEHRDLNDIIDNPNERKNFSEFTIQRLKKRKLHIKDKIILLKSSTHPDIIA